MGRPRKRKEIPLLPSNPVRLADALLYAEPEIRQAVNEERMSLSLLGSISGQGTGHSGSITDRTAAAAMKLSEELSAVVLEDGRTIRKPEAWLEVFDVVREQAKKLERPRLIFDEWRTWYRHESIYVYADVSIQQWRACRDWIRYKVLTEARKAGLVDFDEEAIMDAIDKNDDWYTMEADT